jgi:hypothetical protein
LQPTHGQGLASSKHSDRVVGLGTIGVRVAVFAALVLPERERSRSIGTMELAAPHDETAGAAPPGVDEAATGGAWPVLVAFPGSVLRAARDGVSAALEDGELDASDVDF